MSDETLSPPIPAATIILFRETGDGPAQHLMLERAEALVFAGGALVFPGGRIDDADRALATEHQFLLNVPDDAEEAAAKITAIREAIEETGIAVAIVPAPSEAQILSWRRALGAGIPLKALLVEDGMRLDLAAIVPFARWCPNHRELRRFDTRFFIARVGDEGIAVADGGEAMRVHWLTAQQALDDHDAGHHKIIFPTRRNIERLAAHGTFDKVLAHLETITLRTVYPYSETRADGVYACIPDGHGYPIIEVPMTRAAG